MEAALREKWNLAFRLVFPFLYTTAGFLLKRVQFAAEFKGMNTEQFKKEVRQIGKEMEQRAFGGQKTLDGLRFKIQDLKAQREKMVKPKKDSKTLILSPFTHARFKVRFRPL